MIVQTLKRAFPMVSQQRCSELIDGLNTALWLAKANTPNRSAMFLAEWSQESVNFQATQEWGTPGVNWKDDPYFKAKAYYPYIGRTFGQLTWDYNYLGFGKWMHEKGELDDPSFFLKHPERLADIEYAFDGPAWFWLTHGLNDFADRGDIVGASRRINGGDNGMQQRIINWNRIRPLGKLLLPEEEMNEAQCRKIAREESLALMQAVMLGAPRRAPNTHHAHPDLIPAHANQGVMDRLNRVEGAVLNPHPTKK